MVGPWDIRQAAGDDDVARARELFLEYGASLGFSLCFQDFDAELARLPGEYAPPDGRLLLATYDGALAGCVALRRWADASCEMKRLYVRPAFRGTGLGRALAERVIAEGRAAGYARMLLDTVPTMTAALALYHAHGFRDVAAYRANPVPGATFMALDL
jgi:carbonic anhydrase